MLSPAQRLAIIFLALLVHLSILLLKVHISVAADQHCLSFISRAMTLQILASNLTVFKCLFLLLMLSASNQADDLLELPFLDMLPALAN